MKKPDYVPEPLLYEPESYVSSSKRATRRWLDYVVTAVFSVSVVLGCFHWSWALGVGVLLGIGLCVYAELAD